MFSTILMVIFLVIIPMSFRKIAVILLFEKKKEGLILLIISKILWWTACFLLAYRYIPMKYLAIALGAFLVMMMLRMYSDRDFLLLKKTKKLIKNP